MRQAGRYLPEYRALRERVDFLTATRTPEIAAEITLQPMGRFPLDAAILFSDIMTPLEGMGVEVEFDPGPVLTAPIRTEAQAAALRELDPEEGVPYVLDDAAHRAVRARPGRRSSASRARPSRSSATWWRAAAPRTSRRRAASCARCPSWARSCSTCWGAP